MDAATPGRAAVSALPVRPLAAVGRDDLAVAGGKGANLGELMRAGFAVPDGFVVTTSAYEAAVREGDLSEVIDRCLVAGADGAAIRDAFARAPVPDAVRAAVCAAYAGLGRVPMAVRSSATAEDLPGAAFAGQQDTYLGVEGEQALLDAVRRCWGSLWTDRALAYRRRLGIDGRDVRIAVVVQRMVEPEFAGVLLTADPVTGERSHVVVEAAPGLGEAVVSGAVTPDHYVVDVDGVIRQRRRGHGGPTLPDPVVTTLAGLGRAVERHFGRPQDVEWAYAAGIAWLVQARPMTALPPPPVRLNPLQRRIVPMLLDYLHVRPYPMDMSTWAQPGIGRLVERMMAEIPGVRVDFAAILPEADGVVDRFVPPSPRPTPQLLTAPVRLLPKLRRFRPAGWTGDARFARFEAAVRELNGVDPRALGWRDLLQVPRRALAVTDLVADLRVDYLPRAGADLLGLRMVLGLLRRSELFPLLVLGGRTRTGDANRALEELAAQVRADPVLRDAFRTLEPVSLARRLDTVSAGSPEGTPADGSPPDGNAPDGNAPDGNAPDGSAPDAAFAGFRTALDRFAAEYGHRETTSLLLMSAPTWGEDRAVVLSLVKVLIEERTGDAAPDRTAEAERRVLNHRLVRSTRTAPSVRRIVHDARAGIAFREDTHFHVTAPLPALRRAVLEAGARLAAAGVLRDRDEVLHLRLEEIESIDDPFRLAPDVAERLRGLVRRRSARRAELAGVPLFSTASLFPASGRDADVLVSGLAAGAGRASGPVCIVRSPEEFATLRSGDVLVCPYTNPSWTPLFQRAAAVVVDTGGPVSHAAIVAREYGIPAVMGTGTGTAVLIPGTRVVVDGDGGRVMRG